MALTVGTLMARFDGDATGYMRTSRQVRQDAQRTERDLHITGKIDADTTPLKRKLAETRAAVAAATRDEAIIHIDADTKAAQRRITELEKRRGKTSVDVDAEIAKAQAKIRTLTSRREQLMLEVAIDEEQARLAGEDANDAAGEGFRRSRGTDRATARVARRNNAQFQAIFAAGLFAGVPAAAAVAGAATVAALGVVPAAFIGIGAAATATRHEVASEWRALGDEIVMITRDAADPMAAEFADAGAQIRGTVQDLAPQVRAGFAYAAEGIDPLVDGIDTAARVSMPALVLAASRARPMMQGLGDLATEMGHGVREMFTALAASSEGAGESLRVVGGILRDFLGFTGEFFANLATNGTPALAAFRHGLAQIEDLLLTLTSSGMPLLTGATTGFITVMSGAVSVLESLISVAGGAAGPLLATAGALKAVDMVSFGGVSRGLGRVRGEMGRVQGASAKLRAGMSTLVSGGTVPMMLATAGLGVVLYALGERQREAAERAAELRQAQSDYLEVLARNGNVIDDQVRALASQGLAADGARAAAQVLGVSWQTVTDAALGSEASLRRVSTALDTAKAAAGFTGDEVGLLDKAFNSALIPVAALEGALNKQRDALAAARAEQERADEAAMNAGDSMFTLSDAQEGAATSARTLEGAFETLADVEADVESKGQAIIDVLAELEGRTPSAEEAVQSLNDSIRDIGEELADGIDKTDGWGKQLVRSSGEIDTVTANGSKLQDFLTSAAEDMGTMAKAWAESGMPAAEVNRRLAEQRVRLADTLEGWGLNEKQINRVLDYYGLVPDKISTTAELTGNALEQTKLILAELETLPDNKPVRVDALTEDARRALLEMGHTIVELPDGTFQIFADTTAGRDAAESFADTYDGRILTAKATLNPAEAERIRNQLKARVDGTTGVMSMWADASQAERTRSRVKAVIDATRGVAGILANPGRAYSSLWTWLGAANRARGTAGLSLSTGSAYGALFDFEARASRDVSKNVWVNFFGGNALGSVWPNEKGGVWNHGRPVGFDDGGFAGQVASGQWGVMDANRAAIAQPNSLKAVIPFIGDRTHDREFYIPDNDQPRSLAILQEANRSMLGAPHPMGMHTGGTLGNGQTTSPVVQVERDTALLAEVRSLRAALTRWTNAVQARPTVLRTRDGRELARLVDQGHTANRRR